MESVGVDTEMLAEWMDGERLGVGPIEDLQILAGGTQNILVLFKRNGRTFVLRRPPMHPRSGSNETMRREARLLRALSTTPVPHPKLICACEDEGVLGVAFYLMEAVEGFNPVSGMPPLHAGSKAVQHRMGLALVEALAVLGKQDFRRLGLEGFGRPDNYLERQVTRWRNQLEGYAVLPGWRETGGLGDVRGICRWLEDNRPTTFTPGIMHGDFHIANAMFRRDGPEVAALVDWELATVGDPLVDLGWLLATWPDGHEGETISVNPWLGFPSIRELVEHYSQHVPINLDCIEWYGVFACFKLAVLLEGTHARACAGKVGQDIGQKLHNRAKQLLVRAERWRCHGIPTVGEAHRAI